MPIVTPYKSTTTQTPHGAVTQNTAVRVRVIYACLLVVSTVFVVRLFYLQVIKHDFYHKAALSSQLKQYEISAERGVIYAHDGDSKTPLVLNEKKYTLFADPKYIKDPLKEASALAKIINGDTNKIAELLQTKDTRYVVLAKKLNKDQSKQLNELELSGIGTREELYRTYPQGNLAAQLLGFVNDEGKGQYGIEGYLNDNLMGTPGELKAITDAQGVPLVSNTDNVVKEPKKGSQLQLTIDIGLQRQAEDLLKAGLDKAKSDSGSVMIMEVKTGAVKAMANYPTYDPANLKDITDLNTLTNPIVDAPLEVGSIMKPLTAAAALDQGVITKDTTYFDPAKIKIGDVFVTNVEEDGGPGTKSIGEFLKFSLNTGAVHLLQQMGGGELNQKGRQVWHDYMVNRYGFGKSTGIEQSGEVDGTIPDPNTGNGLNIVYANTSFGQGMTATLLQMGAAYASIVNGGNYVQPHLVESTTGSDGTTTVKDTKTIRNAVKPSASQDAVSLLNYVFNENHAYYGMPKLPEGYIIGGKTGTAQIARPEGGYYTDRYTGTFGGFVGGSTPEYVIVVRVNEPKVGGFAGAMTAAPIFCAVTTMMIDNFGITPKN